MSRENNFDFLRFWLAIAVIFSHAFPLTTGARTYEPLHWLSGGRADIGWCAVKLFFLISGFLIAQSWLHSSDLSDYLRKRILRIYPGFAAAVLLCFLLVSPFAVTGEPYSTPRALDALRTLVLLDKYDDSLAFAGLPHPHVINGSLWTIRYEVLCYLLVPLLLTPLVRLPRRALLGISLLLSFVPEFTIDPGFSFGGSLMHFAANFVAGICFLLYFDRVPWRSDLAALCAVALCVAAVTSEPGFHFLFPYAGGYVLFWFAFHPSIRLHSWGRYGDFSYGIYLYAFPIQQMLVLLLGPQGPLTNFLLATAFSVMAGVVSWYVIERPFLRLARQPSRSTAPVPVASL